MPLTRFSCLYVSSLFFLVAVTGICVIASAYDVIFQIFNPAYSNDPPNYKNLAVFIGSYVLLGLLATIFGFSRYVTVKLARQAIPKTYMPITEEDLPTSVYEFVQSELDRVARLAKQAEPLLEESRQPGWGKPESPWEDTHFKTFMASTPHFIEKAAIAKSSEYARPPNMSISTYVHMLIDQKLITRDIGLEYVSGYEQARFGGTRYDPLPVTMAPLHNQNSRHHQQASGRNPRRSSISISRHPNRDQSIMSSLTVDGNIPNLGRNGTEVIEEEDYIRFMKTLSYILQELDWNQEAYEEECLDQERIQQQREYEAERLERERNRQYYGPEYNYEGSRYFNNTSYRDPGEKSGVSGQSRNSQFSTESFYVVDGSEFQPFNYSEERESFGSASGKPIASSVTDRAEMVSRTRRNLSRSARKRRLRELEEEQVEHHIVTEDRSRLEELGAIALLAEPAIVLPPSDPQHPSISTAIVPDTDTTATSSTATTSTATTATASTSRATARVTTTAISTAIAAHISDIEDEPKEKETVSSLKRQLKSMTRKAEKLEMECQDLQKRLNAIRSEANAKPLAGTRLRTDKYKRRQGKKLSEDERRALLHCFELCVLEKEASKVISTADPYLRTAIYFGVTQRTVRDTISGRNLQDMRVRQVNVSEQPPNPQDNAQDDVQDDVQDDIQDDVQDDVQDNVQDNIQNNVQNNNMQNNSVPNNVPSNAQDNMQYNVQGNVQDNLQYNVHGNVQYNMQNNVQDNMQYSNIQYHPQYDPQYNPQEYEDYV
ncbi:hypothetical protein BGZ49_007126 [Haplosporangium sp. Z 27]|nr:hypothetical protein BGZ49_007126 [Haplosporangium sp. Z 27]